MHEEQVTAQMREMRLSAMADSFKERLARNEHRDISPEQFVALLIEDEYVAGKNRKFRRMVTSANFNLKGGESMRKKTRKNPPKMTGAVN